MFSNPTSNIAKLGIIHGMKVIDIGTGSGFYAIESAKLVGPPGRVYAVDVQREILDRIRSNGISQKLNNIEVVWGNAEKIGGTKIRENIADRIIVSNVLFQVAKPDDFCLEIKRLTKTGGKVLVVDWSDISPIGPKNVVSAEKARLLFEKHGFKLDQSFDAGDHHYGLIFIKT